MLLLVLLLLPTFFDQKIVLAGAAFGMVSDGGAGGAAATGVGAPRRTTALDCTYAAMGSLRPLAKRMLSNRNAIRARPLTGSCVRSVIVSVIVAPAKPEAPAGYGGTTFSGIVSPVLSVFVSIGASVCVTMV